MIFAALTITHLSQRSKKIKNFKPNPDKQKQLEVLNKDLVPFGFAYNPDKDIFYSLMDPWQRDYGYCKLYDDMMPLVGMVVDSEPIRFEYNGKHWLIEFWKGQYGLTVGAEVGIYNSVCEKLDVIAYRGRFYNSAADSEMLPISIVLKKKGKKIISRKGIHWWLTGFKLGEFSDPSGLTAEISITFFDKQMCDAFLNALYDLGYDSGNVQIENEKVTIIYDKPYTVQPKLRDDNRIKRILKRNKCYCVIYKKLTRKYHCTLDKLEYLRTAAPWLYKIILHSVNYMEVYQGYNLIEPFIKEEC